MPFDSAASEAPVAQEPIAEGSVPVPLGNNVPPTRPPAALPSKEVLQGVKYRRLSFIPYAKVWDIEERHLEQQIDFGRGSTNFYAFELPQTGAPYTLEVYGELAATFLTKKDPRIVEPWVLLFDESFNLLAANEPGERLPNGASFLVRVPNPVRITEDVKYMIVTADPTRVGESFVIHYVETAVAGSITITSHHQAVVRYATDGKIRFQMPPKKPRKERTKR